MTNKKTESALENMKFEVAGELGIPLNHGDNGELTSRQAGQIGGTMVKKLIERAEQELNS